MASPFASFRRNQRVLLAILGVMAIIAFVFLDPRMTNMLAGKNTNPEVVSTRFGVLHRAEMSYLRNNRRIVEAFLKGLVRESVARSANPDTAGLIAQFTLNEVFGRVLQRWSPTEERASLETYVLSRRAEEIGIVVTDTQINDVIALAHGNTLTRQQVQQILEASVGHGETITQHKMFQLIRTEMLASAMLLAFQTGLQAAPPAQRWDYYQQVHRQATADVAELSVVDFIHSVEEPSSAQVSEYYEKYKDRLPHAASPEPGFRLPTKAKFEYFKIEFEPLFAAAKEKVTDEEIADYYERNKRTEFVADEPKTKPSAKKEGKDADDSSERPPADDNASPDSAKPDESGDAPTNEKKPASDAPGDATDDSSKPADGDKPDKEQGGAASDAGNGASGSASGSVSGSAIEGPSRSVRPAVRLVAFPADDVADQLPDSQTADQKTDAVDETPDAAADPPATEPAGDAAASRGLDEPAGEPDAADAVKGPLISDQFAKPTTFKPLDDVRDEIRQRLAKTAAIKRRDEIMLGLRDAMKAYATSLKRQQVKAAGAIKPEPLNLEELAKKYEISAYRTELVAASEVDLHDGIYRSYTSVASSPVNFRQIGFVDMAFDPKTPLYSAEETTDTFPEDAAGDEKIVYLFWKVEQTAEKLQPLDAIRPQVVRAWKLNNARAIARKQADAYAASARKSDQPLAVALKDEVVPVVKIGPVTWWTQGTAATGTLHLSEVKGVELAGMEFMKTLFSLAPGEVGVAMNEPQTKVFVIRLQEFTPSDAVLREEFALARNMRDYQSLLRRDIAAYQRNWLADVEADAQVKWLDDTFVSGPADEEM